MRRTIARVLIFIMFGIFITGCDPPGADEPDRLNRLRTVNLDIVDQPFRLWIAEENNDRMAGLMYIDAEQLAPLSDGTERGMIFVFEDQRSEGDGFWMRNVSVPLDIAFLDLDGKVVTIRSMAPFDYRSTYPTGPYQLTIEVVAGTFKRIGLEEGDTIQIPETVLNNVE